MKTSDVTWEDVEAVLPPRERSLTPPGRIRRKDGCGCHYCRLQDQRRVGYLVKGASGQKYFVSKVDGALAVVKGPYWGRYKVRWPCVTSEAYHSAAEKALAFVVALKCADEALMAVADRGGWGMDLQTGAIGRC